MLRSPYPHHSQWVTSGASPIGTSLVLPRHASKQRVPYMINPAFAESWVKFKPVRYKLVLASCVFESAGNWAWPYRSQVLVDEKIQRKPSCLHCRIFFLSKIFIASLWWHIGGSYNIEFSHRVGQKYADYVTDSAKVKFSLFPLNAKKFQEEKGQSRRFLSMNHTFLRKGSLPTA